MLWIRKLGLSFILLILIGSAFIPATSALAGWEGHSKTGPFVDSIEFKVIEDEYNGFRQIEYDELDITSEVIPLQCLDTLTGGEPWEISTTLKNGYGYFSMNCGKYPLNISAFRRAFALAIDKEAICDYVWDGLARPLDSVVPANNPYSAEDMLPESYYESKIDQATQLLDAAGFLDITNDGFREAPNGQVLNISILIPYGSQITDEIGEFAKEALESIGIAACVKAEDFYPYYQSYYYWHWLQQNDIIFFTNTFSVFDVDWLGYEYWSEYADEPYWNIPMFQNTSYDSWRDQLLFSTEYEDVYEAAIEMQKILAYECPIVPLYQNLILSVYGVERFTGYVNSVVDGVAGFWSGTKVHLQEVQSGYPFEGALRWGVKYGTESLNYLRASLVSDHPIYDFVYDSLLRIGPDGTDIPWLAESWFAETHADNPKVPEGVTRMTFNIIQNATWSDGTPLTAEDVAFTLNYYRLEIENHPVSTTLSNIQSAYALTPYQVIVEYNRESYWHVHNIAYKRILPKHIWTDVSEYDEYDPDIASFVSSGPFIVDSIGEYGDYVLKHNPNYFYRADRSSYHEEPDGYPDPSNDLTPGDVLQAIAVTLFSPDSGWYWSIIIGAELFIAFVIIKSRQFIADSKIDKKPKLYESNTSQLLDAFLRDL